MYTPAYTKQFEKDTKRCVRRGRNMEKLKRLVRTLLSGEPLDPADASSVRIVEFPGTTQKAVEFRRDLASGVEHVLAMTYTLTRPGPFLSRTLRLGSFVGVREDGRLIAMAGERMKLPGLTEVSGVCTHPDFRGRGVPEESPSPPSPPSLVAAASPLPSSVPPSPLPATAVERRP